MFKFMIIEKIEHRKLIGVLYIQINNLTNSYRLSFLVHRLIVNLKWIKRVKNWCCCEVENL